VISADHDSHLTVKKAVNKASRLPGSSAGDGMSGLKGFASLGSATPAGGTDLGPAG